MKKVEEKKMLELLDYYSDRFPEAGITREDIEKEITRVRARSREC